MNKVLTIRPVKSAFAALFVAGALAWGVSWAGDGGNSTPSVEWASTGSTATVQARPPLDCFIPMCRTTDDIIWT